MLIETSNIIVLKLGSSTVVDERGKFKKKWATTLASGIDVGQRINIGNGNVGP